MGSRLKTKDDDVGEIISWAVWIVIVVVVLFMLKKIGLITF